MQYVLRERSLRLSSREEREALNEVTFRQANERLRERGQELGVTDEQVPFICECADERCTAIILVTLREYEHVRESRRRFIVAPEHEADDDSTRILAQMDGHWVVEKIGEAGRVAEDAGSGNT